MDEWVRNRLCTARTGQTPPSIRNADKTTIACPIDGRTGSRKPFANAVLTTRNRMRQPG
ncbi:MAG: hypothetical protein QF412_04645 [Planctomycetota bacterium]|nr:hypothetical protein [Planctomycetota bacterium]